MVATIGNDRKIKDINMYADMISGITNYAVRTGAETYMHEIAGHKHYWYTLLFHQWTGQQQMEGWAEFYASQLLSNDYGNALAANRRIFPKTCAYFKESIVPEIGRQIREKAQ